MHRTTLPKQLSAYTLVEVMMALFLFALISLGVTAAVIQSQKIAVSNTLRATANNVVQGYLEQIKSLPISDINDAIANPSTKPLDTVTIDYSQAHTNPGDIEVADPLYLNQVNAKSVYVDIKDDDPSNPTALTMQVNITPTINNLNDSSYGSDAIPAYEVVLDFNYEVRHLRGISTHTDSLRMIMSNV